MGSTGAGADLQRLQDDIKEIFEGVNDGIAVIGELLEGLNGKFIEVGESLTYLAEAGQVVYKDESENGKAAGGGKAAKKK